MAMLYGIKYIVVIELDEVVVVYLREKMAHGGHLGGDAITSGKRDL